MAPPNQTIHLELFAPHVRVAFQHAQHLADQRKHTTVTVHHLLTVMLKAKWGHGACVRAGISPEDLLSAAAATLDSLPSDATGLAYLSANLLAVVSRAEGLADELGRDCVDFQCIYRALRESGHCPVGIDVGTWTREELLGAPAPGSPLPSLDLDAGLRASAKALDGLTERIAAASTTRAPAVVERTLKAIRSKLLPPHEIPELEVNWTPSRRLVLTRAGVAGKIAIEWAPSTDIQLVESLGTGEKVTSCFALQPETKTWTASGEDLFLAVRAGILRLYPELDKRVSASGSIEASPPAVASPSVPVAPELSRLFERLKLLSGEATAPSDEELQAAPWVLGAPNDYLAYLHRFGGKPTKLGLWRVAAAKELDQVRAHFREWGGQDALVPFAQDGDDFAAFDVSASPVRIVHWYHSGGAEAFVGSFTDWVASKLEEVEQAKGEERQFQNDVTGWTASYAPFPRTPFGARAIPLIRDDAGRNLRNVLLDLHLQRTFHPRAVRVGSVLYAGMLHFTDSSVGCWLCGVMTELGPEGPAALCTACKEPLLLFTWAQHRKLTVQKANCPCFGDWAAQWVSLTQPVFTTAVDWEGQKPVPKWARHTAFGGDRDPCALPADWKQM